MGRTSDAKERLLHVAFELIWDNSYGSVSVDRICRKAGVNKGSFYHFFKTKADLAVSAHEMNWRERQPELDRIFSPQAPPLERLSRWCDYLRRRQQEKATEFGHVCGCPYTSVGVEMATQDEKVRRKVEELIERNVRYLESAIVGARMDGVISAPDAKGAARQIYTYALGLLLQARIHNDIRLLDDLKPSVMTLLGAGKAAAYTALAHFRKGMIGYHNKLTSQLSRGYPMKPFAQPKDSAACDIAIDAIQGGGACRCLINYQGFNPMN